MPGTEAQRTPKQEEGGVTKRRASCVTRPAWPAPDVRQCGERRRELDGRQEASAARGRARRMGRERRPGRGVGQNGETARRRGDEMPAPSTRRLAAPGKAEPWRGQAGTQRRHGLPPPDAAHSQGAWPPSLRGQERSRARCRGAAAPGEHRGTIPPYPRGRLFHWVECLHSRAKATEYHASAAAWDELDSGGEERG